MVELSKYNDKVVFIVDRGRGLLLPVKMREAAGGGKTGK
jgi:hypothetical protein